MTAARATADPVILHHFDEPPLAEKVRLFFRSSSRHGPRFGASRIAAHRDPASR
jgi:hypothetical protein